MRSRNGGRPRLVHRYKGHEGAQAECVTPSPPRSPTKNAPFRSPSLFGIRKDSGRCFEKGLAVPTRAHVAAPGLTHLDQMPSQNHNNSVAPLSPSVLPRCVSAQTMRGPAEIRSVFSDDFLRPQVCALAKLRGGTNLLPSRLAVWHRRDGNTASFGSSLSCQGAGCSFRQSQGYHWDLPSPPQL